VCLLRFGGVFIVGITFGMILNMFQTAFKQLPSSSQTASNISQTATNKSQTNSDSSQTASNNFEQVPKDAKHTQTTPQSLSDKKYKKSYNSPKCHFFEKISEIEQFPYW